MQEEKQLQQELVQAERERSKVAEAMAAEKEKADKLTEEEERCVDLFI